MITRVPQLTNDLFQYYGQDLQISGTGSLLIANLATLSQQRVIRRLMTSTPNYIWHPTYGAGLSGVIGEPLTDDLLTEIRSIITANLLLESTVSPNPQPQIFLNTIQGGLYCQINYSLNPTLEPIVLNYQLSM